MTRILAIEPDAERAAILQRLMTESLDAKIMLASSANDATMTLASEPPDVILASSLLPPKDEEHLIAHLRQMPELRHLPVLVIPPVGEQPEPQVKGGIWSRFRRRRASISPAYDFQAVTARIEEAVEQSRLQAASAANVETVPEVIDAPPEIVSAADVEYVEPIKRNRAQRWTAAQLPWLSSIKLAWGRDLRLLNISRSGVLVESGVRFTPGTTTMLQIAGTDQQVAVSATIVRSRVAAVDSLGVTYQSAATFERTLDLL
jgi:CheY-like chemotaxis protein